MVSWELFPMLGVNMLHGRAFTAADQEHDDAVTLIGERLFNRKFNSDPAVIGRNIRLGSEAFTVIGVVPQNQMFPSWADLWLPMSRLEPMLQQTRRFRPLEVVARLKPGIPVSQARAEMAAIASNLALDHPETNRGRGTRVQPALDRITQAVRPGLLLAWMAVVLVLLIACANLSHLFLARTISRQRELAIRLSLGATYGDIARLIAAETALLVGLGGALGVILAAAAMPAFKRLSGDMIPRADSVGFDLPAWLYTLAAVLIIGVVIATPSYLMTRRLDLAGPARRGDGIAHSWDRGLPACSRLVAKLPSWRGAGPVVMASQVAIVFVVLASTMLVVRGFRALLSVEPGFDGTHVLAVDIAGAGGPGAWEKAAQLFENRLAPEIAALPGVEAVATANMGPLGIDTAEISRFSTRVAIPGQAVEPDSLPAVQMRWVSSDYFKVLRIALIRGRWLAATDRGQPRYLINETLARRFFPDQDPTGKRLLTNVETAEPRPVEIAGVVGDVRDLGLDIAPEPTAYLIGTSPVFTLLVRSVGDLSAAARGVAGVIHQADPDVPIKESRTVDQLVTRSLARYRFALTLMLVFAGLGAALCVAGVYGVVSFSVGRRRREFGIRAATGASPINLIRLVLGRGLIVCLVGLGVGLLLNEFASRFIRGVVFGVSPNDPAALTVAATAVVALCIISMLLPARRAGAVDPAIVLRDE